MSGIDSVTMIVGGERATVDRETFNRLADGEMPGLIGVAGLPPRGRRRLVTDGDPDEPYPVPIGQNFVDRDTMRLMEFIPAADVKLIAERLIEAHPDDFAHLAHFRITYLWKLKGGDSAGKATFGQCQKASGLVKHFGRVDFVVWLAADNCGDALMTRWQIEALVYHELLHTERGPKGKPTLRPHDFAGFDRELLEYGSWQADLQRMVSAARQLPLPEGDDDERA